jgi:hypothetical protein
MRISLLAFAITALICGQATAAELLTKLKPQQLIDIAKAGGSAKIETSKPEAGVEIVSIGDSTGTMDFVFLNCAADGCTTLQMATLFAKDSRFTLSAINGYNATYLNAQASLRADGEVLLARLYTPVGGVTEDNLKANLVIFANAPDLFSKHILSLQTVAAKPVTTPVASSEAPFQNLFPAQGAGSQPADFDVVKWRAAQPNKQARTIP